MYRIFFLRLNGQFNRRKKYVQYLKYGPPLVQGLATGVFCRAMVTYLWYYLKILTFLSGMNLGMPPAVRTIGS